MLLAGHGILRSREFNRLAWDERTQRAAMGDILRVHEWAYVRMLRDRCAALPRTQAAAGALDSDTAFSHGTFSAALAAAGAVCTAVDAVMAGKVRHNAAFSKDCLIMLELANIV